MTPFNEQAILDVLHAWYDGFDTHAPIERYRGLLAGGEFFIDLPPGPKTDFDSFSAWYQENNRRFFDGKHTLKRIEVSLYDDHAVAVIPMRWDVRTWNPGDANSAELHLDMVATVTLVPDQASGEPRIQRYEVQE